MSQTKRPSFPAQITRPIAPKKLLLSPQAASVASSDFGNASAMRNNMVQQLKLNGINDNAILMAMAKIIRHDFVEPALFNQAYRDNSLPIGLKQTISKPSVVARMLQLLNNKPRGKLDKVLEIGSGCGYQAAVLAQFCTKVYSIERLYELYQKAQINLKNQGINNIQLLFADGMLGHSNAAPYDGIISAAGGKQIPQQWLDQLAIDGRLITPLEINQQQVLVVIDKISTTQFKKQFLEPVLFVPLRKGIIR